MLILRAYKFSYPFSLKYIKRHEHIIYFCSTSFYRLSVLLPPPNNQLTYYPEDRNSNVYRNVRTATFLYASKYRQPIQFTKHWTRNTKDIDHLVYHTESSGQKHQ